MPAPSPRAQAAHQAACVAGEDHYIDPDTGYFVFTAVELERRERCCGAGCRHCPFGHAQVRPARREVLATDPWIAERGDWSDAPCDVLSWSGGKDSMLALARMLAEAARPVVLLSTFDGRSHRVAHQEITTDDLRAQAQALGLPLVLVPLSSEADYLDRLALGLQRIRRERTITRLAFGDLHLEHIRDWREASIGPVAAAAGASLTYPLWQVSYDLLMSAFEASGAAATVSAVAHSGLQRVLQPGAPFGRALVEALPDGIDAFGENGEYHSCAAPPSARALADGWRAAAAMHATPNG